MFICELICLGPVPGADYDDFEADNLGGPQSPVDQNLGQLMAAPGGGPPDDGDDDSGDAEEDEEEGEEGDSDDGSDAESNVMVVLEPDHVSLKMILLILCVHPFYKNKIQSLSCF